VPLGGKLEPREGVDRYSVRVDPAHVAEGDLGAAPLEQPTDALAEPGEIVLGDWPADGEGERLPHFGAHPKIDRPTGRNSSRPDR
jgi:hypothetical protein